MHGIHVDRKRAGWSSLRKVIGSVAIAYMTCCGGWLQAQTTTPSIGGIAHAATFANVNSSPAGIARGAILSIFGTNLATGTASATSLPLPTQLPGIPTQVLVRYRAGGVQIETPAPLFYVSPTQINCQLPPDIPADGVTLTASLVVRNGSASSPERVVTLVTATPGVFTLMQTGSGPGTITHADGSLVSPTSPVRVGEFLAIYGTGMGVSTPAVPPGQAAPDTEPLSRLTTTPTVRLAGKEVTVAFAGKAPRFVGLDQINVQVPDISEPTPEVTIQQGSRTAPVISAGGPGLSQATPLTAATGSAPMTLTARGVNLTANARLNFGGRQLTSAVQAGPTQTITATVPESALRVAGDIPVYVTSPETGNTHSNEFTFSVTGNTIPGSAPVIANLNLSNPERLGPFFVYTVDFDFSDPDGDIVYNGTTRNSARVELRFPSCTLNGTGTLLNFPDQPQGRVRQFQWLVFATRSTPSTIAGNVTLIDQAGNRSNTLQGTVNIVYCP